MLNRTFLVDPDVTLNSHELKTDLNVRRHYKAVVLLPNFCSLRVVYDKHTYSNHKHNLFQSLNEYF